MAKVSKRLEHDWVMVTARFEDGTEAKAKWNRGGMDVSVTPSDPAAARTLSVVLSQAQKEKGLNIGLIADAMEAEGLKARTLFSFVESLKAGFGVSGEMKAPAGAPSETRATAKASRGGWLIEGTFPSGEKFELKLNKASVGLRSNAPSSSQNALMKAAFAVKGADVLSVDDLAERVREAAEASSDMDGWAEAVRGILSAAPRP